MSHEETPAFARIVAVGSRKHGIVDLRDLEQAGVSRSTILLWVRSGRLHRIHRGVYSIVPPAMLADEGRWLAAVLACGPGAVLSHAAAAELLGLIERWRRRVPLHVSVLDRRRVRLPAIQVHRPRHLEARDVIVHHGIPTTTETRTLFDQASVVSRRTLREQFERAEYLEKLDRGRLRTLLIGATGRRGIGNLERLAGYEPLPLSRTRSRLERIILSLCRTRSLPVPGVNVPLLDYEVDFLWPEALLVIEADGGQHRGEQRSRDNKRDLALQLAGYLVRRFTEDDLLDEAVVAEEILELLTARLAPVRPARDG